MAFFIFRSWCVGWCPRSSVPFFTVLVRKNKSFTEKFISHPNDRFSLATGYQPGHDDTISSLENLLDTKISQRSIRLKSTRNSILEGSEQEVIREEVMGEGMPALNEVGDNVKHYMNLNIVSEIN